MAGSPYKTALVTGASSGIGAATVRAFRAQGLAVHALARDGGRLAALAEETGCIPHALSIDDQAGVTALCEGLEIDVLVNNAGQNRLGNILDNSPQDIDALIDVNLRGVLQVTRLVLAGMVRRDRGHVVNVSSIAGHYSFDTGNTTYHVTKAGIHALSQQLRCDLFGTRVRVTEVSPARVETEIYGRQTGDLAGARRRFFEEYESLLPEDIADAIVFATGAPPRMNVSFMEILPTMQAVGGWRFARTPAEAKISGEPA